MSDRGDRWPGDTAVTRISDLSADERRILAALAVVGRASLSTQELGALVETASIQPLIDELERRGLLRSEEDGRHSTLGRLATDLRKLNDTIDTANRLVGYFETLARGGKLTAARLEQDAEAILGISAWAAEVRRWETLLEFVKTVQASFALAERIHEQRVLLELGRTAARTIGDRASEIWCLRQLTVAADRLGDTTGRFEFANAADSLERAGRTPVRLVVRTLAVLVVAGAGIAAGAVIGRHGAGGTTTVVTTRRVVEIRTVAGGVRTRTVVSTVSSVTTDTVTSTFTTTVAPSLSTFVFKVRPTSPSTT